ncbi:MAG: type II toxin-antitoxin system RelE/ParE family toxin [Bdellovibrionales bacterium]|jgi:phage-related protein|nr:type II toxin-antitoxin system RelE/ParE family toxin [Bdellovibrionales bacterium]MBT3524660.1 type II toxin-antitoxin system RelE/ParE family toxin [Bdellovibrionales bacterium]MBT7670212.1 type II toxin-antitoxin system RelE/ParE family toxin [Bdellovibrionales bacterium]MBT7767625.1 type II toxin-antitoxin system RelE/ParE family toxin [Bdellovibrionales bacterium]
MDIEILETCKKELRRFPSEIIEDFVDAVAKLKEGLSLAMPLSRKMPSIGPQVYELRFRDMLGAYRVIYFIKKRDAIYMVHAFTKKSQKTPQKNLDLAQKRVRRIR